jgi:uncharacterized protein YsxB (DUF464 family)
MYHRAEEDQNLICAALYIIGFISVVTLARMAATTVLSLLEPLLPGHVIYSPDREEEACFISQSCSGPDHREPIRADP